MIMPNLPGRARCPECGSDNIATKWSCTTIVAWLGKLLGAPMVRIYEKKCMQCGKEFKVFRK